MTTKLEDLPNELILDILEFCDRKTLELITRLSKRLNDISNRWKHVLSTMLLISYGIYQKNIPLKAHDSLWIYDIVKRNHGSFEEHSGECKHDYLYWKYEVYRRDSTINNYHSSVGFEDFVKNYDCTEYDAYTRYYATDLKNKYIRIINKKFLRSIDKYNQAKNQ